MNRTILQTLFLDNPEIPVEIAQFCKTMPGYAQAEREYNQAIQELEKLIGFKRYSQFENAMTGHLAYEVRAYYLFGLGLRREILAGMAGGIPPPPASPAVPLPLTREALGVRRKPPLLKGGAPAGGGGIVFRKAKHMK